MLLAFACRAKSRVRQTTTRPVGEALAGISQLGGKHSLTGGRGPESLACRHDLRGDGWAPMPHSRISRASANGWSSISLPGAACETGGFWTPWGECRARLSCRITCGMWPTTTARCRSGRGRPSRSRSWWPRCCRPLRSSPLIACSMSARDQGTPRVRDHHTRHAGLALEQLPEQALGGPLVAPPLDQGVEHDPILVDGPPQPVL